MPIVYDKSYKSWHLGQNSSNVYEISYKSSNLDPNG